MRWRRDNALAQGQTMDANIQETADVAAKHKENQRPEVKRHTRPHLRIENSLNHFGQFGP
jgi:hypothetical protein